MERRRWLPPLLLLLLCVSVYSGAARFAFLSYDDDVYVTANPRVLGGLTGGNAAWAFTTFHADNWHPLTWISHMADVELFGTDAGMHHLVNLLFHCANSLLLFFALRRMTGSTWRSCFAAALFAVHPLHVESVAWVSERKDLLSTFFLLAALPAYAAWVREGRARYYGLVLFLFASGLLSKPMVVTLPILLLLLDYWPLARLPAPASATSLGPGISVAFRYVWILAGRVRPLLVEKIPLFLLSLLSCLVTLAAQGKGEAIQSIESIPPGARVANALLAYVSYLRKTAWPSDLAVSYPHFREGGGGIPYASAALALLVLISVTAAAIRWRRSAPFLAVGWAWYLVSLLPVIGLVQVGRQAMADRYTYVPLIGIFVAVAWGGEALLRLLRRGRALHLAAAALTVLLLAAAARVQASYWKDGTTLYGRALEVTSKNWVMEWNLGEELFLAGRAEEAIPHLREAVRLKPDFPNMRYNYGCFLRSAGRGEEAEAQFREVLRWRKDHPEALRSLGLAP